MNRNRLALVGVLVAALSGCIETEVVPDPPRDVVGARVAIVPADTALEVGASLQFMAQYWDPFGDPATTTFQWASSSDTVVGLQPSGAVVAVAAGQATVVATAADGAQAEALITVVPSPLTVASFAAAVPDTLYHPATAQLTAQAQNLSGEPIGGLAYRWETDTPASVSLSPEGELMTTAPGSARVRVRADGVVSPWYPVVVLPSSRTATIVGGPIPHEQATGTAQLVRLPSGALELRLADNFSTDPGPGLFVYLSNCGLLDASNINTCARVELGRLQRTQGAQVYAVPTGVGITQFSHVLIQCKPFNVTFGSGALSAQ